MLQSSPKLDNLFSRYKNLLGLKDGFVVPIENFKSLLTQGYTLELLKIYSHVSPNVLKYS